MDFSYSPRTRELQAQLQRLMDDGGRGFEAEIRLPLLDPGIALRQASSARLLAAQNRFEQVRIGFRDSLPRLMELVDNFGQTTTLLFARFERNPKLDADTFRFTPPKGADVLTD